MLTISASFYLAFNYLPTSVHPMTVIFPWLFDFRLRGNGSQVGTFAAPPCSAQSGDTFDDLDLVEVLLVFSG